jgi:hypothetical protein
MRLINPIRGRRFCAFCKSPRKIYIKKHIDATNVVLTLALAIGLSYVFFGGLDPRVVVLWPTIIIGAEVFIYLRWRSSLTCTLCGFDPVAYKRSPAEASLKVGQFFNSKTKSADFMLSRSPLLAVHKEQQDNQRKMSEYARVMTNKSNRDQKDHDDRTRANALKEAKKPPTPPPLKAKGNQVSRSV